MGFDFRSIRYLLHLNLDIKKHDLVKSRVFYEVSCASSGALPEELQKQVFNFLVALELAQVWRKPFSVKAQLFRQRQLPAPQLLQQVRQYLHEQYAQKLTLDVLSARYNISKYHLQRSFQHYFGQSPGEYLTQLRLTRAKELLRATDLPVFEIAYRVGMENTSYFIYTFRTHEGTTPRQYRKRWATFDEAAPAFKKQERGL